MHRQPQTLIVLQDHKAFKPPYIAIGIATRMYASTALKYSVPLLKDWNTGLLQIHKFFSNANCLPSSNACHSSLLNYCFYSLSVQIVDPFEVPNY
jgi:hypothetical protein